MQPDQTHAAKADGVRSVHGPVQQSGWGDVLPPNWSSPPSPLCTRPTHQPDPKPGAAQDDHGHHRGFQAPVLPDRLQKGIETSGST